MSASSFFTSPFAQPFSGGVAQPLSELNFWVSGLVGTTRLAVYSNAALTTPLPNPVIADGTGTFPEIFLQAANYGVVWTTSTPAAAPAAPTQLWAADPYSPSTPSPFTGDTGTGGAAGSVPAPPAGSAASNLYLGADGGWDSLLVNPPLVGLSAKQAGYLGAPFGNGGAPLTANYQPSLADLGKMLVSNAAGALTITIPSDLTASWPLTMSSIILLCVPNGLGAWTIAPAAGVSLYSPPTFTASGNRTFTWGLAALERYTTNAWMLTGTNIS